MIEPWKWLTIHGLGTSYRVSAFKFTAEGLEIIRRSGFGTRPPFDPYIGILVWGPRTRIIIDNPQGFAPDAIRKAGLDDCCVLREGVQTILNRYEALEDGSNLEISGNEIDGFFVKTTKGFQW